MAAPERLIQLRFPAQASRLKMVRGAVRNAALMSGMPEPQVDEVVLAVSEACMNVMQHAYGPGNDGDIIVEILREPTAMTFRVIDFAEPVDCAAIKSRDLDDLRPGGLGVHFISQVMDSAQFLDSGEATGNVFEMTKKINRPEETV